MLIDQLFLKVVLRLKRLSWRLWFTLITIPSPFNGYCNRAVLDGISQSSAINSRFVFELCRRMFSSLLALLDLLVS